MFSIKTKQTRTAASSDGYESYCGFYALSIKPLAFPNGNIGFLNYEFVKSGQHSAICIFPTAKAVKRQSCFNGNYTKMFIYSLNFNL